MSTHRERGKIIAVLAIFLFLMPMLSFAEETGTQSLSLPSPEELQRYQLRYEALGETFTTRLLRSSTPKLEFDMLVTVNKGLLMADADLSALVGYLLLADMVTEKQLVQKARDFVRSQYGVIKRKREINIEYIERTLQASGEQETTKLLLEARDLHRSVADFLGRIDNK